jgi:hypothetical protein
MPSGPFAGPQKGAQHRNPWRGEKRVRTADLGFKWLTGQALEKNSLEKNSRVPLDGPQGNSNSIFCPQPKGDVEDSHE